MVKTLLNPFKYEPLSDYIEVELQEQNTGGIIVPNSAQLSFITAIAKTCGPKCMQVKQGDLILFANMGLVEARHDGQAYRFTQEDKVAAIIRPNFGAISQAVVENFPPSQ